MWPNEVVRESEVTSQKTFSRTDKLLNPGFVKRALFAFRTGRENNWYSLTGRVVAVKVEADGDLHLALKDATGDKPGIVVCEVLAKSQWC
jgi:hypothetical protein